MTTWTSPTGFIDPSSGWQWEEYAYDEGFEYGARTISMLSPYSWSPWLHFTHSALNCDKIRYYNVTDPPNANIEIWVHKDNVWVKVYEGPASNSGWREVGFAIGSVDEIKLRIYNGSPGIYYAYLLEIDFGEVETSKSFKADGVLQKPFTKTFTADAVLSEYYKEVVADALLQKGVIKPFTGDAFLTAPGTKTLSADAYLVKLGIKNLLGDAILKSADIIWTSPTGHIDPESGWLDEERAYDEDPYGTGARTTVFVGIGQWSPWLHLTHSAINCDRIRYFNIDSPAQADVEIWIHKDSVWIKIYEGVAVNSGWREVGFSMGSVDEVKLRIYNGSPDIDVAYLMEFDFGEAPSSKTFKGDALLQKPLTKTLTADAYLAEAATKIATADALLQKPFTKTFLGDAVLLAGPYIPPAPGAPVTIPEVRIEIFRGPPYFMDDNFVKVWAKTSGGTSAFSTDGDLATLDAGSVAWCTVERSFIGDEFSSTTYPYIIVRITDLDAGATWRVSARYDAAWHTILTDTETGVFEAIIPTGKTVQKIEIAVGGTGKTCKYDYLAVCKDTLLVPSDTFDVIDELIIITPLLQKGVAGANLTFPNFDGEYTDKITPMDRIIIYLNRKGDAMKKMFGGKITNPSYEGGEGQHYINLECMGLGEQLHAPSAMFNKQYDGQDGKPLIQEGVALCLDLTDKFVDVDGDIASTHDIAYDEQGKAVTPFKLINEICQRAKTAGGIIGFDAYVDPAGNVHVFKYEKYTSGVTLSILGYGHGLDGHKIRNKITVFGCAEKPNDSSKDYGTDMATPYKGSTVDQVSGSGQKNLYVASTASFSPGDKIWIYEYPDYEENEVDTIDAGVKLVCLNNLANSYGVGDGVIVFPGWGPISAGTTITADATNKIIGSRSVKVAVNDGGGWGGVIYHFGSENAINMNDYKMLNIFLRASVVTGGLISLMDVNFKRASFSGVDMHRINDFKFYDELGGRKNEDAWNPESGFDWTQIIQVEIRMYQSVVDFWVDGLFFGNARWSGTHEDTASSTAYGVRIADPQTFDEINSDAECVLMAKAIIDSLKEIVKSFRQMQVEGCSDFVPGDKQPVVISNDNVDDNFRSVEIRDVIHGVDWDTFLSLSDEKGLVAFVFAGKPVEPVVAAIVARKPRHVMRAPPWI